MPDTGPRSALIIEVPEAEPIVGPHRSRLDPGAALGIPAHITVLFPFLPLATIDTAVLSELERLFALAGRFRFRLERPAWFGENVLWLAPGDDAPFRALTQRVFAAHPGFPPYEGRFDDVVPHLTIGEGRPLADLRAAEESVRPSLPIDCHAAEVTLLAERPADGRWTRRATFALGQPGAS